MRSARLALLALVLSGPVVAGVPVDPVMPPPVERLPPKLQAARDALRAIVARKDMAALVAHVRPESKLDFGGTSGPAGFREKWDANQETRQALWRTLEGILALPGVPAEDGLAYCSPYVFCADLPGDFELYDALVVLGSDVAVRARPSRDAAVLRRVDHAIVNRTYVAGVENAPGWSAVTLADGTSGYVSTRWIRDVVDFRLSLRLEGDGDRWWLEYLLAGD